MPDKARKKRIKLYGMLTLAVMCFIFVMSAQDGEQSGKLSDSFLGSLVGVLLEDILPRLTDEGAAYDIRKYAHMFEFACLGVSSCLLAGELLAEKKRVLSLSAVCAFGFSFLYACSDEWHQTFVPGRAGLLSDVLVDAVGVLFGVALVTEIKACSALTKRRKQGNLG